MQRFLGDNFGVYITFFLAGSIWALLSPAALA